MPDSPAVDIWRRHFRLNLSASWKAEIDKTVQDVELWMRIINNWRYRTPNGKWNRKAPGIKQLLDEYDRFSFDRDEQRKREQLEGGNSGNNQAPAVPTRGGKRLSARSDSDVSKVRSEPPSLYFRTG